MNETSPDETILHHGETAKPEEFLTVEAPQHVEIAGAYPPANWVEKDPTTGFITYPKRNQALQDTCTAYSLAKVLSIDELQENGNYRELSPRSIYAFFFQPGGGANSLVQAQGACKQGLTLEYLLPTDNYTEAEAESAADYAKDAKIIGTVYAPGQIVQCATDFETIASILHFYQSQGIKKGIMITIVGSNNATWYSLMPQPPADPNNTSDPSLWYHKVVVTDFGLIKGQKYLAIDNSWGTQPGNQGQQFLGENYAPAMYGGMYTLNQTDNWMSSPAAQSLAKPKHQWTVPLQTGSSGPDVLALQQALQTLGMFPVSTVVQPSGQFFGITKAGVIEFQASFGLPQTGIVDGPTIAKLNSIFAV